MASFGSGLSVLAASYTLYCLELETNRASTNQVGGMRQQVIRMRSSPGDPKNFPDTVRLKAKAPWQPYRIAPPEW